MRLRFLRARHLEPRRAHRRRSSPALGRRGHPTPSAAFDAIVACRHGGMGSRILGSSIPSAAEATLRLYRPNGEPLVCRGRGLAEVVNSPANRAAVVS